ncbi:hypothetical protein [Glycomyces sp. NPDC047010]|uniref:hypothetical protein n=1 Tax=Glycomyces sp. NPDC047010 TaxID=3155023 RepID=UPI0034046BA0
MGRKLAKFTETNQPVKYMGGFDHALIHCPRCDGMAVRRAGRVTCESCAYTSELDPKPRSKPVEPPRIIMCPECDRYVGSQWSLQQVKVVRCLRCGWTKEPDKQGSWKVQKRRRPTRLWLEVGFRGERLWAVNEQHLSFLEDYVAAGVRETGPFNSTIASRLPAWIKSGKNRNNLLRALAKLRARLPGNMPLTR